MSITQLSSLAPDQEGEFFALLSAKEELTTRDGKPYFRVSFRDAAREVSFPIWSDAPWFASCRDEWTPGAFYKARAFYRETKYGPQLDLRAIREATEDDRTAGFDPDMCLPRSRFQPEAMFHELTSIVTERIRDETVRDLVVRILNVNRPAILVLPAATHNHHAFVGGFLEHVLSVTKTCIYLAEKYAELYPELDPPLDVDLAVAGAVLHDIGKLRELAAGPAGAEYTASGSLVGHILLGRDILREAAAESKIDPEKLLRLEHVIVAHQRLAEWGSPKPPMTPEAMIVHYADDLDAKLQMLFATLKNDTGSGPMTSGRNPLRHAVYRGGELS
jgi:3'-5' exoribonuclease